MSENEVPNVEAAEVSEAPVEEAPAAPVEEESLSDIVSRHATAATEETPVETEQPEAAEEQPEPSGYTAEDIADAVTTFNEGPDSDGYEQAVNLLDALGMIEYEEEGDEGDFEGEELLEDEYEDDPFADLDYDALSPEELKLIELEQQVQELLNDRDLRAQEQEQALAEKAMAEAQQAFELELDKHFAAEGETFPRDPSEWTSTQRLQAQLTAAMESGEEAQRVLKAFEDERIAAYISGKPEAMPSPEVGGASTAASSSNGSPRDDIAKIVSEHLSGGNISQG